MLDIQTFTNLNYCYYIIRYLSFHLQGIIQQMPANIPFKILDDSRLLPTNTRPLSFSITKNVLYLYLLPELLKLINDTYDNHNA